VIGFPWRPDEGREGSRVRDFEGDPHAWRGDDTAAFARRLPDALGEAVAGFAPYDPGVIARGVERGRRIRRRRRLRVSSMLCVAAIALAVGVTWDGPVPGRTSEAGPARVTTAARPPAVTEADMIAALRAVLPADRLSDTVGRGSLFGEAPGARGEPWILAQDPYVSAVHHGLNGATGVEIAVSRPASDTPVGGESTCVPGGDPRDECVRSALPTGGTITTRRGFTLSRTEDPQGDGQREWEVYYDRPDGGRVVVRAYGGGPSKSTKDSVRPMLDVPTMEAMARNPVWDRVVDALPPQDAQALGVLTRLMPGGVTVSSRMGAANEGGVVLHVGEGATTVHVMVQPWDGSEPVCDVDETNCVRETLPDGTRLLTARVTRPGDDATTWRRDDATTWRVAAARPDGVIVHLDEVNRDEMSGTRGGPEPLLSIDRLRDIALSPLWAR